mmetsp:Transcript_3742/g.14197  ORF Transcript_3742/g.14197 Transcript_3742/m.14197 type:complete len:86 (-) Transcript_3742:99-356(-)
MMITWSDLFPPWISLKECQRGMFLEDDAHQDKCLTLSFESHFSSDFPKTPHIPHFCVTAAYTHARTHIFIQGFLSKMSHAPQWNI